MSYELPPHKWADFLSPLPSELKAPEFIIDDVITAGTVVIAGERGLGKTSALVPLMAAAAGLTVDFPLKATIRRHVVYVSEDVEQVQRILMAMRTNGHLIDNEAEVEKRFKLVPAARMKAEEITKLRPHLDDLWDNNDRVDGGNYCASPVLVLDTTNATIDLDNISDNSEVSKAVSTLREGLNPINVILVGHIAKSQRSDIKSISFVGAGAWEGDTQQNLYLVSEDDCRYLVLGKKRFETDVREYLLQSHCADMKGVNKLGEEKEMRCFYSIPEPISDSVKAERKAEQKRDAAERAFQFTLSQCQDFISKNPGVRVGEIKARMGKRSETVGAALEALVDGGQVTVELEGKTKKYFPATSPEGGFTL